MDIPCKTALHRAAALTPQPDNLLDHLGVLAAILDIPLIVSEPKTYDLAVSLYPQVKTIFMEGVDLTLEYLAANYDTLFVSSKPCAAELYLLFPLLHGKKMRIVYCPHGNSDKGHTLTKEQHASEDVALVYGDHMLNLLRDTGMLDQINQTIVTGNYRYTFFREHRPFYEALAREKTAKLDSVKKTIFYAPTWQTQENPSSFYTECAGLIEQLPSTYNLLIKPHPHLYEQQMAKTISIVETYKDHPQVLFLEDFPPIYPLLSLADIYLGDFSSIGYDFLAFDKPMYFFNPSGTDLHKDRGRFLHRCGMEISTKTGENVFDVITKTLERNQTGFSQIRKETYEHAFGKEKTFSSLRQDISFSL
jgi:hypothetical protein